MLRSGGTKRVKITTSASLCTASEGVEALLGGCRAERIEAPAASPERVESTGWSLLLLRCAKGVECSGVPRRTLLDWLLGLLLWGAAERIEGSEAPISGRGSCGGWSGRLGGDGVRHAQQVQILGGFQNTILAINLK